MKPCSTCKTVKPRDDFYAIGNVCKACQCARNKAYRQANYERVRARELRRENSAEYRADHAVTNRAWRARRKQGSAA